MPVTSQRDQNIGVPHIPTYAVPSLTVKSKKESSERTVQSRLQYLILVMHVRIKAGNEKKPIQVCAFVLALARSRTRTRNDQKGSVGEKKNVVIGDPVVVLATIPRVKLKQTSFLSAGPPRRADQGYEDVPVRII